MAIGQAAMMLFPRCRWMYHGLEHSRLYPNFLGSVGFPVDMCIGSGDSPVSLVRADLLKARQAVSLSSRHANLPCCR